jgi:hypothetical protein
VERIFMSTDRLYAGFLGTWSLIPESCHYEQGAAPRSGSITIAEEGKQLRFTMRWTVEGVDQEATFIGRADGEPFAFDGGPLADAMKITAVAANDLRTSAFFRGRERMVVQRQLDGTGQAMRVTQLVRLPDGSTPANVAVYRRAPSA